MHTRRTSASAAVAALALLSACADQPTAPASAPHGYAFASSASAPALVPNAVRYRDTGGKPATGRSGSAALDAWALLGRDGVTDVELRARAANPANPATGTVARAQAKVYSPDDSLRLTRSAAGGQPLRLPGLPRGTRVDVQANVTGIDGHRTDVVSVSQTVRLRPDLSVEGYVTRGPVYAGTPVVVAATIRERNGDVGAQADCELLLDGRPADQALRIWVDAGDRVNCFLTLPSLPAGTHQVTIRAVHVAPGDWDTSNNAWSGQVTVHDAPAPVNVAAWVRNEGFTERTFQRTTVFSGGYGWDDVEEQTREGTSNGVTVQGFVGRGFTAPLTLRFTETDGGRVLQSDEWTVPDDGTTLVCSARWNTAQGTSFHFCSYFGETSTFQFYRASGTVTYHGLGYHREWDEGTGDEYVYHWDNTWSIASGEDRVMSDDYGFSVQVGDGANASTAALTVPLAPFEEHYDDPDWCMESGDPSWGWFDRLCWGGSYHASGFYGFGSFTSP